MTEKYTLNDIFRFEDITKVYCVSKAKQLSPQELIKLAATEERFDYDYAMYLHFKHEHQVTEFISRRDRALGRALRFLSDTINEIDEVEFEDKVNAIPFKTKPTVFDILDVVIRDRQWDMVFYIYQRETIGLANLISQKDADTIPLESVKDRKFFILQ